MGSRAEKFRFFLFVIGVFLFLSDFSFFAKGGEIDKLGKLFGLITCIIFIGTRKGFVFKFYRNWKRKHLIIFLLYLFFNIQSFVRTNNFKLSEQSIAFKLLLSLSFLLLCIVFISSYSDNGIIRKECLIRILSGFFIGLILYFSVNALLYFALPPILIKEQIGQNFSLRFLGINRLRSSFPLFPWHPYNVAVLAGGLFTISGLLYLNRKSADKKLLRILLWGSLISVLTLMIGDSRGVIFFSLFAIILTYFSQKTQLLPKLKLIVLILPFLQVLLFTGLTLTADWEVMKSISRKENTNDLATGNSRIYIFEAVLSDLKEPKLGHLFGYGEYGLYKSGAINAYAKFFGAKKEQDKVGSSVAHNMFLNTLICQGYFGVIIFMLLMYLLLKQGYIIYQSHQSIGIIILGYVTFYLLSGLTDGGISFGAGYPFITFIIVFTLITSTSISLYESENYSMESSEANNADNRFSPSGLALPTNTISP